MYGYEANQLEKRGCYGSITIIEAIGQILHDLGVCRSVVELQLRWIKQPSQGTSSATQR